MCSQKGLRWFEEKYGVDLKYTLKTSKQRKTIFNPLKVLQGPFMSINVPMTKFDTSRITNIVKNVINKCSVLFFECHSCHLIVKWFKNPKLP